jgi:NADH-quinone oxidoreductase subunit F
MGDVKHILLRWKDVNADFTKLEEYRRHGGFEGLKKALGMTQAQVIDEVKNSGLRGRGGAGFPTGVKWSFIPQQEPIKYLVVNADESETGTFKDRLIMETNPYQLLEGILIGAYAIGARDTYIYLRGEFWDLGHFLDDCIEAMRKEGLVGDNIMGSGFSCNIYTHLGAGAYICGEETALLNSLEGKLGQPRVRPPFPANKGGGLYSEPTVVNNVETIANVPWIVWQGASAYKAIGTEQSAGTKLYCVSGHVKRPGVYELPFTTTFRELLFDLCGGPAVEGRNFKALLPSGGSGPIVALTDQVLDTRMSYEDTSKVGTIIGSASLIVMDDSVDVTWVASKVIKFFKHESCGKCTPCREGTYWLDKVLDRILAGEGSENDVRLVENVAKNMAGITLCALGEFAANPVIYTVKNFPDDFKKHVKKDGKAVAKPLPAAGD